MTCSKVSGQKTGGKRLALQSWLEQNPQFTMAQLVQGLSWSLREADNAIQSAKARGELKVIDRVVVPGSRRPVAIYGCVKQFSFAALSGALAGWTK